VSIGGAVSGNGPIEGDKFPAKKSNPFALTLKSMPPLPPMKKSLDLKSSSSSKRDQLPPMPSTVGTEQFGIMNQAKRLNSSNQKASKANELAMKWMRRKASEGSSKSGDNSEDDQNRKNNEAEDKLSNSKKP
jgi:hypothetical protein